jgi:hypothetical protein
LEPQQPQEPAQPAPSVAWAPPAPESPPPARPGEPVGELHGYRSPSSFTLGDAFSTGIGLIGKPTFIVPVLIIGVIVNAAIELAFGGLLRSGLNPSAPLGGAQVGQLMGSVAVSLVFGVLGGILINLYGQIWAVSATSGPMPQPGTVFGLAGRRWVGVIGVGIVVAVITILLTVGLVLITGILAAALGELAILVALAAIVVAIYVGSRLTMAGWLAADGLSISNSISGSWQITQGQVLRVIGWNLAYGIAFGILAGILGAILGIIPLIGAGIAQAIGTALGYGAGVTLYRRVQAAASPPAVAPAAPVAAPQA